MAEATPSNVTQLLRAWSAGEENALEQLIPVIYDELHRLAHRYMARERAGHLLETTALINEAYLKLADIESLDWQSRAHFYAISAQQMRRILVDYARSRNAKKRGGSAFPVTLDEASIAPAEEGVDLAALDEALFALALFDERKAKVVEMRFFGGFSVRETAGALSVSEDTVLRDWRLAKSWLLRELSGEPS
jgi:RNA polymerase sigma factor (TIGR02999 family)